ncbi:tRNA (guanosine(46)-N7)-methyltransferase TrmB [Citricoccus sp. GCM10030269]|uniref:tRNA (guanosine(46)-N7)-methyltransferase TrmB n=1 Tax=Citricoccus sp. GCM10030269 TaxID=3273388 RepID=UPI003606462E
MTSEQSTPSNAGDRPDPHLYRSEPVSFVRRGDRLNPRRQKTWDRSHAQYIVEVPRERASTSVAAGAEVDWSAVFGRTAPLLVDIGSGLGESTAQAATDHPDWNIIAVEVYTPGLAALLVRIEDEGLENIRGIQANAPEVLDHLLPEGGVQEVWVFFPDPWHKTRHHKRRLVSPSFAERVSRVLAPGGVLRLATDWSSYAEQMRAVMEANDAFENLHPGRLAGADSPLFAVRSQGLEGKEPWPEAEAADPDGGWAPRFDGRPLTSFENKALRAGRLIFDLTYRRT